MVDTKRIQEMKELGIVERKNEETGLLEYTFKSECKHCGKKVEWCFCTKTLEEAKKILKSKETLCDNCWKEPKTMPEYHLRKICQELAKYGGTLTWDMAVDGYLMEIAEMWGGESLELEDGTEYWQCECPMEFQEK